MQRMVGTPALVPDPSTVMWIAGRDAAAGVGDQQFDGIAGGLGRDQEAFHQRIAHGFGGVVDQVDDDSLKLFRIHFDGGKAGGELDAEVDAGETVGEDA